MLGLSRCLGFGGSRVDAAIGAELLRAVEPMAIEAALQAEQMHMETQTEQRRIAELELQHSRRSPSSSLHQAAIAAPQVTITVARCQDACR